MLCKKAYLYALEYMGHYLRRSIAVFSLVDDMFSDCIPLVDSLSVALCDYGVLREKYES